MPRPEWFKEWFNSPFYQKLYFERNEQEAKAFIEKLIALLNPLPSSRMLDIACGRGRHSNVLASLGFQVTGIDISLNSIEHAKQSLPKVRKDELPNPEFFVHDIRLPFWGNYFDYAFNFYTSFGYFKTQREHNGSIRNIARSLKRGGIFVIDYLNVPYAGNHLVPAEEKKINNTVYSILRWQDEKHFFKKITLNDPTLLQPISFTEKVAKFSLEDFTGMLTLHGMQVKEVFGDYHFHEFDINTSPRLIIISSKRSVNSPGK